MLELTPIPMEQFPLRWRLTDPKYRVLPPAHLEQITPLDPPSAKRLMDITEFWYRGQPFTRGVFSQVVSTPIGGDDGDQEIRCVRKWLWQRGVPFRHRVLMS